MFIKKTVSSKDIKVKAFAFILAIILLFSTSNQYSITAEAKGTNKVFTVLDDGVTYTITQVSTGEGNNFVVTSNANKDKIEINIGKSELDIKEYEYEGKNFFGIEQYDISKNTVGISEYIEDFESFNEVSAQAIKYGSKTTVEWGKHWYCYGSNGSKSYMKIGHTATYRIRTDTLSSAKETKCDNFANAIKKSNSLYKKAYAYAGGSSTIIGVAAGLVAANVLLPPTVIITIVVAAVGGGGTIIAMVNSLIDSYDYYLDCKDLYAVIKGYGTKI